MMATQRYVALTPIAPAGMKGHEPTVTPPGNNPRIAVADAGSGKIMVVSAASGYWNLANFQYESSSDGSRSGLWVGRRPGSRLLSHLTWTPEIGPPM